MALTSEDPKIMSLVNIDLRWTPYSDRFITFGNDLKLFVVDTIKELPQTFGD